MKFIITGGASLKNNLGDQAMILTLVEGIKKNFSNPEIVLFDEETYFDKEFRDNFAFKILPDIPMKQKLHYVNRLIKFIFSSVRSKQKFPSNITKEIINEYESCDYIFQLSGFSISDQMKFNTVLSRIWDIAVAKKLNKKIFLLPQSVGPLDFKVLKKILFNFYLKKYINYPESVYCRERMGENLLTEAGCTKAESEHDIVLSRPNDIDLSYIYKKPADLNHSYSIDKNRDFVVIPNFRLLKYKSEEEVCSIFERIIRYGIKLTGGRAYLFCHVKDDDKQITKLIYDRFAKEDTVILVEGQFNCMDAEKFFSEFAFGIASRWHANVHFIRAGLPFVIIGWAEKYKETARHFGCEDRVFDIREKIVSEGITSAVKRVYYNREEISKHIVLIENEIKKTFCLDRVFKEIKGKSDV